MFTGWVSEAWPLDGWDSEAWSQDGFLRHGRWVGFRGMAAGCVTALVSDAWSLGGFLRHGHRMGL